MSDTEGIKSFLHTYLQSKKRVVPEYTFTQKIAGRGRTRFLCELRVDTFEYVGIGNSTAKKDAQTNAARDFVNFLVREGHISSDSVPTVQAEEVDLTADLHGGWSMESSKARLNEYLQATRQQVGQIKYTAMGPDHNRSYIAEMTVHVKKLKKNLYAREAGSNKQLASRACCLSLVRQLYHSGEIECYTGEKRKKKHAEVAPRACTLNPTMERHLSCLYEKLGLTVSQCPPDNLGVDQTFNMITNYNLVDFDDAPRQLPQTISWCPPFQNWNPWSACNIDEGIEASMSLAQISSTYMSEHNYRFNNDSKLRSIVDERSQLPVHAYRQEILDSVNSKQITLIRGETGCGKTTQVPQIILDSYIESGKGSECSILVTQPRRISAISLAERIAYERGEVIGSSVGYSVRFETIYPRPYGSILFCTVGTMARKMESGLRGVSHIIVDEIHERDVNTDFMLILLRDMIRVHSNLRIVLMSATIDIGFFTDYFGDCNVLNVEGRTHPVEYYFLEDCIKMLNYVPPPLDEKKQKRRQELVTSMEDVEENCNLKCDPLYGDAVAKSMSEIIEKEIPFDLVCSILDRIVGMNISGAVLIFLPGWNIISLLRKTLQMHRRYGGTDYLILPLHSQIPREDQRLVFRPTPPGVRKIVLSTNIAESSITINDVVFVIDFCLSRTKLFTARNNLTSYSTSWSSKTNLEQRRGRAGRVRPGFAFHLCSRARFERLEPHDTPEILRTPLHELALMIKLLHLGSVGEFLKKALQSPPMDAIIEAEHILKELKAFDKNDELTPLGLILARLPVEPRLGKMVVFACSLNLGGAASILAATASLGCDSFVLPPDRRRLSNRQRSFAADYASDHLANLNVFQVWSAERARQGEDAAEALCERLEFNSAALRLIDDAANQLRTILINLGFPECSLSDSPINFNVSHNDDCDLLGTLLTMGLFPNVCCHSDKRKLATIEGTLALVHKGSVNCSNNTLSFTYPYFVFGEKIRTQAVSCKGLTMVNPIQLMLFGCRSALWYNGEGNNRIMGTVMLDDWIPLQMSYSNAAHIFALRPALDALLVRACIRPEEIEELQEEDQLIVNVLRQICTPSAMDLTANLYSDEGSVSSPPKKRFASNMSHPLLSGRSRRNFDNDDNEDRRGFERYANHPERNFSSTNQKFNSNSWQSNYATNYNLMNERPVGDNFSQPPLTMGGYYDCDSSSSQMWNSANTMPDNGQMYYDNNSSNYHSASYGGGWQQNYYSNQPNRYTRPNWGNGQY